MKSTLLLIFGLFLCGTLDAQDIKINESINKINGSNLLVLQHTELDPGKSFSAWYQLMDADSNIVVDEKYAYIQHYTGDIFVAFKGKWGVTTGKDAEDKMKSYGEGGMSGHTNFLIAELKGSCGLINSKGKLVLPMEYSFISFYSSDFFTNLKGRGFAGKDCHGSVYHSYSTSKTGGNSGHFSSGSLQSCSPEDIKGAGSKKWKTKISSRILSTCTELDKTGELVK